MKAYPLRVKIIYAISPYVHKSTTSNQRNHHGSPSRIFQLSVCYISVFGALLFDQNLLHSCNKSEKKNQPQQPIADMSVTRNEEGNQNLSVQRNRKIPRENDEQKG